MEKTETGTGTTEAETETAGRSDWLIALVDEYRARIRDGAMFRQLRTTTEVRDRAELRAELDWTAQLAHQSRQFTRALSARSARCRDDRFHRVFADHAREEAGHPAEHEDWMRAVGLLEAHRTFCDVPMTAETTKLVAYFWYVAEHGSPEEQVVVMNLVSEGVAFDFYTTARGALSRLGLTEAGRAWRYWRIHEQVDLGHMLLGVDLIDSVSRDSPMGHQLSTAAAIAADLYDEALASWCCRWPVPASLRPPDPPASPPASTATVTQALREVLDKWQALAEGMRSSEFQPPSEQKLRRDLERIAQLRQLLNAEEPTS